MNHELISTLKSLRRDPTVAIHLYEHLFKGRFWTLVADPAVPLESLLFLTYPTQDGVRELPVFTTPDRSLMRQLAAYPITSVPMQLDGETLWNRMLDIARTGEVEVAVDPGEEHGIRLKREMILGMVGEYGIRGGAERPPLGPS